MAEKPGKTLDATARVHETHLRLKDVSLGAKRMDLALGPSAGEPCLQHSNERRSWRATTTGF